MAGQSTGKLWILWFVGPLFVLNCAHSKTPASSSQVKEIILKKGRQLSQATGSESATLGDREEMAALTEYNNCAKAMERFPGLFRQTTVECTKKFLLYESQIESPKKNVSPIRIGSFNIIRIGQSQSRFKRNDFVAQIINQWDLATVVEIMTSNQDIVRHNAAVDALKLQSPQVPAEQFESSYEMPRYLMILKALRDLDPSWSLIMSALGTGETTASYEYVGFFYRAGLVQGLPTAFCDGARACSAPIRRDLYENLVSRSPFVAHFKIGALDFNAAGLHVRFRVPTPDCSFVDPKRKDATKCAQYSSAEMQIVNDLGKLTKRKKPNIQDARYLELGVASKVLNESPEEVLLMGDFNLELAKSNRALWDFAIAGGDVAGKTSKKIYVNEKTSISQEKGLSKKYDHFIYDPAGKSMQYCLGATAKVFSFVLDPNNPSTSEPALKDLAQFLKTRKSSPKTLLQEFQAQIDKDKVISHCQQTQCDFVLRRDEDQYKKDMCVYERNVLGNNALDCRALEAQGGEPADDEEPRATQKKTPYKVYHELVSDHIPIQIDCRTF